MAPNDALSSANIEARLKQFEQKLDIVYRQFEQYFIGVEKRPPTHGRREVARMLRELEQTPMIRTDLKFRYRALAQRFNSYKSYWSRTERQIEEGTYHRDVARARARQVRREQREEAAAPEAEEAAGQTTAASSPREEDGAFLLDELDFEDLDLSSLELELEQMDQRGEFEKYVGTQKISQPPAFGAEDARSARQPAQPLQPEQPARRRQRSEGVDPALKKKRLAELQAKLGLSPKTPPSAERAFARHQEGMTQKAQPENPDAPARGADISKLRKLRRAKERIEKERALNTEERQKRRIIRRRDPAQMSDEERTRKVFNDLIAAKKRCNEDTSRLNYDSFRHTIERQRTEIQRDKGAREVDFKVVIKDGRAFIKPQTK